MHIADTTDLLYTKLMPPRPAAPLVAREALLARLEAGLAGKLTLISAPAGFGKTTLAAAWLTSRSSKLRVESEELPESEPVQDAQFSTLNSQFSTLNSHGWVSLDEDDNDPIRFWRYVIAASRAFRAGLGQAALARLHVHNLPPFAPPALEPALTLWLNDLASLARRGILVLEDYHTISAPQVHAAMEFVIDHLPESVRLVLLSRNDPPLPLARLRARGELCELRAGDLRFSPAETAAFVAQALPFPLPAPALARLDERTEGWAAGLRLAVLALRGRTETREIAQVLDTFSGSQRPVVEYLVADVLHAQPEPIQAFLLQTSILGRLTASLCDAVTGRADGADMLDRVARANLFLQPLDDIHGWYRYHALFAEAMRHAARDRLGAEGLHACYRRASAWYEQHGLPAEAVDAALAGAAWERAATLVEQICESQPVFDPREPHTLRRWLEQFPKAVLHARPALCFSYGMVLLRTSDRPRAVLLEQFEELGRLAEQSWRRVGNLARLGQVLGARALLGLWKGRMDLAIALSREALALLPADDVQWRGVCLGFAGRAELQEGRLDPARQMLLEGRTCSDATDNRPATRAHTLMLGDVCAGQGELQQAAALYRQALADALEAGDLSDQAPARLGLARLAYEWNDLATAGDEAQAALELAGQCANEALQVQAALEIARIQHARKAIPAAQQGVAALLARLSPHRAPLLYREVLACQARLALAAGDLASVQRWWATRGRYDAELPRSQQEQEALLGARLLIAQAETEAALHELNNWLQAARADGRIRSTLEIQIIMAGAHAARDDTEAAGRVLRVALAGVHAGDHRRLFLDEGAPQAALLRTLLPTLREQPVRGLAQTLVQAFALEQAEPGLPVPLSPQEQRVLGLLVAGRSNPEIAEDLVVSVNTVKTQLKCIYRKLGVTSRHAACDLARHLRLL